ncbi:hypothetical protein ACI2UK_13465 [Ralstonia nicotianae]|uniref:hypothetical protein n=1 Tax=Ralstonia pseudosolanacearum TaxID=1310165 RepID=UPI0020054449|nr:hypothetical protein [Ralstonia pseudosolanacearum]MCK4118447.1 hypothetical protein [Ralstonia pseudosolanacearum]
MNNIHQDLIAAGCLIAAAIFAVGLCVLVIPSPTGDPTVPSTPAPMQRSMRVRSWIVLACVGIAAGHLIAYYVLGLNAGC